MVFAKYPVLFSNIGRSTSRRPESCVLVVVAIMIFCPWAKDIHGKRLKNRIAARRIPDTRLFPIPTPPISLLVVILALSLHY
jgi:hypothetical protein